MRRSLTRSQAAELLRAAGSVPSAARSMFLSEVDTRLSSVCRQPLTDGDVQAAIASTLSGFNVNACSPA
jgi:hypothetical protein